MKQPEERDEFRTGDKVRVKKGTHAGARGMLQLVDREGQLLIRIEDGTLVRIERESVTNYSLAARRAWQVMPKRAGRQPLSSPAKKMVSMRLDIQVWKGLAAAAEFGWITSREQAVNEWLAEKLNELRIHRDLEQAPRKRPMTERSHASSLNE